MRYYGCGHSIGSVGSGSVGSGFGVTKLNGFGRRTSVLLHVASTYTNQRKQQQQQRRRKLTLSKLGEEGTLPRSHSNAHIFRTLHMTASLLFDVRIN